MQKLQYSSVQYVAKCSDVQNTLLKAYYEPIAMQFLLQLSENCFIISVDKQLRSLIYPHDKCHTSLNDGLSRSLFRSKCISYAPCFIPSEGQTDCVVFYCIAFIFSGWSAWKTSDCLHANCAFLKKLVKCQGITVFSH